MGNWKYVVNQENSWLDEDNDGTIDADEYWAIETGNKTFGNFEVNVLGTAEPGFYRMKFKVSYRYQVMAPLNESGVGNDTTSTLPAGKDNLFTENEALGAFGSYYWVPWNGTTNNVPANLVDTYVNDTANFEFHKRTSRTDSGSMDYDNIWEAIPDNGNARPNSHPDLNGDGITSWIPTYPAGPLGNMDNDFDNGINVNFPTPPDIDQHSLDQNKNAYAGNGTWMFTGNVSEDIDWGDPALHTEDVWVTFIIKSTVKPAADLNEDNETNDLELRAKDNDYYSGSVFEEFLLNLHNMEPGIDMIDVSAMLTLPPDPDTGGFEFYGGFDTAKVNKIESQNDVDLTYRITIDKQTPPGYYYCGLELTYTKQYPTGQTDPLGDPLTTDVVATESHFYVQLMVDFTPDLGDAEVIIPGVSVRAKPTTQIDTSTGQQMFRFTVYNTGNVELWGGNKTDGNLHLQFAEFTQMGKDYYDSDADPGVELEPINIANIPVDGFIEMDIPITVPYHWYLPEGVYRLYLNFTGYYYDDGVLGDPTGFVYMQMDWEGFNDDGTNRTCFVKVDKTGNEMVNDAGDTRRMTEGIYTEIYINKFDPTTKELAIINWTPKLISQEEELHGGAGEFTVTFQNQQTYTMYNVYVEVDIGGYFENKYYYDWDNPTRRVNPKFYIDMLEPYDPFLNNNWTVNFTIDDVDKLLPHGEHHIPIKYSYDYNEYQGVEEMSTFSLIWDTTSTPFEPYIDANANFLLNKGGGTRAGNMYDIVFVVDGSGSTSSTYRTYLSNSIDSFKNDLINQGINYEFAVVGFNENSWVSQDFTTDTTAIKLAITSMPNSGSCGVYDGVVEAIRNMFVGQQLSYRQGAIKVVIMLCQYYPNQGLTDENQFALAVKGEAIFFGIARTNYWYRYDLTALNTGGQLFDIYGGSASYPIFLNNIANALTGQVTGVTPTGRVIADVPLKDVADPQSVNLDTYGPYIVVEVFDSAFDIDTALTSSPIDLGRRVRNINMNIRLTNREFVQYKDVELMLPLNDTDGVNVFVNPLGTPDSIEGQLSTTTLSPDGGQLTATFNLDVNTNIDSGIHVFELEFRAMNDYTKEIRSGIIPVQIRILPRHPILIIPQEMKDGEYTGKPIVSSSITPGDWFTLTFTIQNVGDDAARDIYLTLSNYWYEDNPFTTVEAFISAISVNDSMNIANSVVGELPQKAEVSLEDLGISSVSDIVDAERQLLSPTAVVPRFYISEIPAGGTYEVKFRMKADTHMIQGRPYKEFILLEYIDSDGTTYGWDGSANMQTNPIPIVIQTKEDDSWPKEEGITSETLAVILIIIIIIIIILLFLGSVYNKRRMEDEGELPPLDEEEEDLLDEEEEDLEDEMPEEEEEEIEEELPEDIKDEEKEIDSEWDMEEPSEDEDAAEEKEEDDDWDIEEDTKTVPAKGKAPTPVKVKGKTPGKAPADKDEIEDW
jgi:hypothetical protein